MARVIVECIGCKHMFHKNETKMVYRGQKGYGYQCKSCEAEAHKKTAQREATNTATEKAVAKYYTLTFSVKKPTPSITAWLESLGYKPQYNNFGVTDFIGNEVQGFQSITKLIASYDKRFENEYSMNIHCRDHEGNEIDVKSLDMVRLFSKYKGYSKVIKELGL